MISSIPKWIGDLLEKATGPLLTVTNTVYITPSVKKISLHGNISKMSFQVGYANVIRVSETDYRNYTVAHYDTKKGILEIIGHIHGNGPGSHYMDRLQPGEELYISLPRGHAAYDPKVKRYFIVGDETSLGLACSFLPFFKQNNHEFQYYFELGDENKNAPDLLGLENYTVYSKHTLFRDENINDMPVLQTKEWQSARFVLTGNVKSVQCIRKVLKGYAKGKIISQGYWLEGKKGL